MLPGCWLINCIATACQNESQDRYIKAVCILITALESNGELDLGPTATSICQTWNVCCFLNRDFH